MSTEEAEKVIVAGGVAREGLQDMVPPAEEAAAKRLADLVSDTAIDQMIADAQNAGVSLLDGPGGLIGQLTARVIERALGAEMDDHLGYVKGDPAGNGSGNSRNGFYGKTLTTTSGPVHITVPRDRKSAFEPQIVGKGQRRVGQVDDMILSLYARGMTTRDIHAHLAEIYGVEGKQSAHARVVMGSAGCDCRLRGECLRGRSPGPAEHEVVQDVQSILAVLAGGVDVTADVEPVLGNVVAGQAAGYLLLGFQGAHAALADVIRGPHAGVLGEQQNVAAAVAAEFQQLAAGFLLRAVLRAGDAGNAGQPGQDGVPELVLQRFPHAGGDGVQALLAGGVPAWIRPRSARCACTGQTAPG